MNTQARHKISSRIVITSVFVLFALQFVPFFGALFLASLFAFALHDYIGKLTGRGMKKRYATLTITLASLVFIAAPFIYVILKAVSMVKEYAAIGITNTEVYKLTEKLLHDLTEYGTGIASRIGIDLSKLPQPAELLNKYSGDIGSFATAAVANIPDIALNLFVFFLALYYFLNESQRIKSQFMKWDLLPLIETDKIITIIKRSSRLTLVASILIGMLQATVVSTVAYFCGFTEFFIIFILTSIFSLIPVVGSAPTALFLMLIAFVQGNAGGAIAMLAASIVAGTVDNLVKPFVLNNGEEELHPILALLTIVGAIMMFGAIGILIGPIITQLALNLLPSLTPEEKSGEMSNEGNIT